MKIAEVRGKDPAQLELDIRALRKEQFELRFKGASEQNANPARFRQIRKDLARILTVLKERASTTQAASPGTKG
jgi:large subunit ribosomal protein L29